MPRIAGVVIPDQKQIAYALPHIFGLGRTSARKLLDLAKIDPAKKAATLTSEEIERLQSLIEAQYVVEGQLRSQISDHIKRLVTIGTRRGSRHERKLPVRGQHTRKNARTRKGKKMTVATGRRPPASKT